MGMVSVVKTNRIKVVNTVQDKNRVGAIEIRWVHYDSGLQPHF